MIILFNQILKKLRSFLTKIAVHERFGFVYYGLISIYFLSSVFPNIKRKPGGLFEMGVEIATFGICICTVFLLAGFFEKLQKKFQARFKKLWFVIPLFSSFCSTGIIISTVKLVQIYEQQEIIMATQLKQVEATYMREKSERYSILTEVTKRRDANHRNCQTQFSDHTPVGVIYNSMHLKCETFDENIDLIKNYLDDKEAQYQQAYYADRKDIQSHRLTIFDSFIYLPSLIIDNKLILMVALSLFAFFMLLEYLRFKYFLLQR